MQLLAKIARRLLKPSETIDGYEQAELVDVIFQKTLAYKAQGSWPEIEGASSVLDFGGGCGLHYKQAQSSDVRWAVVETPAMVSRAQELATDRLKFFSDIQGAAAWLGSIDVMHSNGALQYTPEPLQILNQLCSLKASRMLWTRLALGTGKEIQTSFLGDNGPGSIQVKEKIVRYERTMISESDFLAAHEGYTIAKRGLDWFHMTR
jgi:putative methyltransferase (TIGR04325 family)